MSCCCLIECESCEKNEKAPEDELPTVIFLSALSCKAECVLLLLSSPADGEQPNGSQQ